MTGQHPAVTHLLAAHERAERLANASGGGKWSVVEIADCGCCDQVRNETGGLVTTAGQDDAPLIAEHANPTAVLARVAAERGILGEHTPTPRDSSGEYCMVCSQAEEQPQPVGWWMPWPCRTVLGLAGAWGWKADT